MIDLSKQLKAKGIEQSSATPGKYNLDCPKKYCQDAREGSDPKCLKLEIVTGSYAHWKCRHCLWSDHIGEKPELQLAKIEAEIPAPSPPPTLSGIDKLNSEPAEIIITQREADRLIVEQCGFTGSVALPAATPAHTDDRCDQRDQFSYLAASAEMLRKCPRVKIAFDDTAEGNALQAEIARRIGPAKCWIVKFCRGTLERTFQELGIDGVCADIQEAAALPIHGLYQVDDFERELTDYFEKGMAEGLSTGWPNVDKLYTVMVPQLTLVTGIPGSGKSEWIDALTMNLALNNGWKFAAFSPENGKAIHTMKLIEKRVEMPADPKAKNRMSYDTMVAGAMWVRNHYYFIENTQGTPTLDWILDRASDAVLRYGVKGIILDPWNRMEKKLDNYKSETDYVAEAIPRILRFNANHGVHCWLVVHPKQQEPDRKTGEISAPSLYAMAGSAHFVNMADNGIVIHRSTSIDDTTEVHVNKVRFKHVGRTGKTKLKYNFETGRFSSLDAVPNYTHGSDVDEGIKTYEPT